MFTSLPERTDDTIPVLESVDDDPCSDSHGVSVRRSRDARRKHHWTMLVVASVVIVLATLLTTMADERVALGGIRLPPTCASRALFGVNCPGCGLTRSFVLLAHGDWSGAWQIHRLGWLLALATVAQIPYRLAALRFPDRELLGALFPKFFAYLLIGLLVGNWLMEQVGY